MTEYNHREIEKKWQAKWQKDATYKTSDDLSKPKYYVLDMFPYPSGQGLHVGHPKGYIATDILSRFKRMSGFNVLHPMGWDAFGLPAENYALKNKLHPRISTEKNVARYKEQLEILGVDYDWSREINTTDPSYYKWTQWIFLQLFNKGLAFESFEPINWCPSCKTALANEDLEGNACERCGTIVEKKPMRQWVLKITDYADRLLQDIEPLDWPKSIKELQRNWIGRSEGSEISFQIKGGEDNLSIFTTRADTLMGVTYLVVAPEHEIIKNHGKEISNLDEVLVYAKKAQEKTEIERGSAKEKTGVRLEGVTVLHPITKEELPVFVADYVLGNYGTGAVMAVPAHDERDYEFAQRYDLPIKQVVAPFFVDENNPPKDGAERSPRNVVQAIVKHPTEDKMIQIQWKQQPWQTLVIGGVEEGETFEDAVKREVAEETGYTNFKSVTPVGWRMESRYYAAHKNVNREARVQVFVIELENLDHNELTEEEKQKHEVVWVNSKTFPNDFNPVSEKPHIVESLGKPRTAYTGDGVLVNSGKFDGLSVIEAKEKITLASGGKMTTTYKLRDWVFGRQRYWGEPIPMVHDENGTAYPVDESELPVMLPEVESYEPSGTGESPLATIESWVNVEGYITEAGTFKTAEKSSKNKKVFRRETNTMPQWAGSSWYYLRYMDPHNDSVMVDKDKEKYWAPVDFYVGGAEHATRHLVYARFWHKFLFDIGAVSTPEPFKKLQHVGLILGEDGRKMSKRFGNVVNPDEIVNLLGADTMRIYEMFMGPFANEAPWNTENIAGSRRFIERVWRLQTKVAEDAKPSVAFTIELHKTIKKVTEDIERFSQNTAISQMMILVNYAEKETSISPDDFKKILLILAPFAPHVTEELWTILGIQGSIHNSPWPTFDESLIQTDKKVIGIQIDGKVRGELEVSTSEMEEEVKDRVSALEIVQKWLVGREVAKFVYVPGRIVSIVTKAR
jgi:leucyl-tRNA synthetase